jgi:hypothetical protein
MINFIDDNITKKRLVILYLNIFLNIGNFDEGCLFPQP